MFACMADMHASSDLLGRSCGGAQGCSFPDDPHWCIRNDRDTYVGLPTDTPTTIDDLGAWLADVGNHHRMQQHVARYFAAGPVYTGSLFEWFAGFSILSAFTPWDFLAVESLSVTIPTRVQHWLLTDSEPRHHLVRCVGLVDADATVEIGPALWNASDDLTKALSDLYDLVRAKAGMGKVTTSKLIAAKFPNLVPIRDSKVEELLGLSDSKEWWGPIRESLGAEGSSQLMALRQLEVPSWVGTVSELRRLDVVLWMEQRARERHD